MPLEITENADGSRTLHLGDFVLYRGGRIPNAKLVFKTWGELNDRGDNGGSGGGDKGRGRKARLTICSHRVSHLVGFGVLDGLCSQIPVLDTYQAAMRGN